VVGLRVVDGAQARTWAARLAAPVAFFVAAVVLITLIQQGLDAMESDPVTTASSPPTSATGTTAPTTTRPQRRRFYRVRSGDTLESIAARFDTTVADLIELNPTVDPLALNPGSRIRVF
jgi:LysM repeat protein